MLHHQIICGNSETELKQFDDNTFDSCVTDPPYGLEFMGKDWDKFQDVGHWDGNMGYEASKDAYGRIQGKCPPKYKTNDKDLDFQQFTYQWATELYRVLKPGAHILVFGGTRTYHRMACAIEDSGFEVRDMINWVYGSGFPKSLDISKSLDKAVGKEREVIGKNPNARDTCGNINICKKNGSGTITAPTTEEAIQWNGWGTGMKPAHEPILLARKPISERNIATNVVKWGVGGINVDECRIGIKERYNSYATAREGTFNCSPKSGIDYRGQKVQGRFPANCILSCTCDDLMGNNLFILKEVYIIVLKCQSNHSKSNVDIVGIEKYLEDMTREIKNLFSVVENANMPILERIIGEMQDDICKKDIGCLEGTSMENINANLNMYIYGKSIMGQCQEVMKYIILMASKMIIELKICNVCKREVIDAFITKIISGIQVLKQEKSQHHKDCVCRMLDEQSGNLNGEIGRANRKQACDFNGVTPFGKLGVVTKGSIKDTGGASRFFYQAKASQKERWFYCTICKQAYQMKERDKHIHNAPKEAKYKCLEFHPTQKPESLISYLMRLITPPNGTVIDPFLGSGTAIIAAEREGFNCMGIDSKPEYCEIAYQRGKAALVQKKIFTKHSIIKKEGF